MTATTVVDAKPRESATISGRVVAIRIESIDAQPEFGAQVDDGTGRIDAIFMGRRSVPGIEPGAHVSITGTVCSSNALPRMFNPRYELLSPA
jgi:RecJ-like exonuclease